MNLRNISAFCALVLLIMAGWPLASPAQNTHTLPLVLPASNAALAGFVRIINLSGQAGTVSITAIDDAGMRAGPVTLSLSAREVVNFNSRDLEQGNAAKGLPDGVGDGEGNWRLVLETALNITPLAYIRTTDGFVTAMHAVAPETEAGSRRYRVVFFNPGANQNQVSRLRLINPGTTAARVEITGRDDAGAAAPGGTVRLTLPAGAASTLTAQALEAGGDDFEGRLGDGAGKWRLTVTSNVAIEAVSLLQSPTGHLANLSAAPGGPVEAPEPPAPFQAPEMVTIPAGSFMMGSPESEANRHENEGPVHPVTIAYSFAVGKYEVTRGEFARFVSETGREIANICRVYLGEDIAPHSPIWRGAAWREGRNWRNPGFTQTDDHPVVCVSWFDAKAYVEWLSEKTGDEYRLLSESEWEYVARGGTATARYWGESAEQQCRYANGADISSGIPWGLECDDGHARTAPVGGYGPNPYGAHDMMGNVLELVEDGWWTRYNGAPVDESARVYGGSYYKPIRGGSWRNSSNVLRSAYRRYQAAPIGSAWVGFRVARTLTASPSAAESVTGPGAVQAPGAVVIGSEQDAGHGGHGADGAGGFQ